jgi:hypothetical protein
MGSGEGRGMTPDLEEEVNGDKHYQTFHKQKRLANTRERVH